MINPIPTCYWYFSDVAEVSCTCYVAYVVSLHYGITFFASSYTSLDICSAG